MRQAYALYDQDSADEAFQLLTEAVAFGEEDDEPEQRIIARAHIIYLQLLLHDFRARGDMFSTLLTETDERQVRSSHVLCDLFRVDVAVSRRALREGAGLLSKTRMHAASIGEYALFIPIGRREYIIGQQLGRLNDPHLGSGYALGALIPPEAANRRFDEGRLAERLN